MKKHHLLAVVTFLLLFSLARSAFAYDGELDNLFARYREGYLRKDMNLIRSVFSQNLVYGCQDGGGLNYYGYEDYMGSFASALAGHNYVLLEFQNLRIAQSGNMARADTIMEQQTTDGLYLRYQCYYLLTRERGGWKIYAFAAQQL